MPPTLLPPSQGQPTLSLDMAVKDKPLGCTAYKLFAKKGSKDSRNLWHSEHRDLVIRIPYFTELFGNLCVKVAISHTIIALVASAPTGEN